MFQILLWLVVTLTAEPLIFRIPDGTKRDSYIGNLPQNAKLNTPSDVNLRKFVLVTGSDLIQIDETSGDIRTAKDVDREALCHRLQERCSFDAEIISTPKQFFQLFKVEIFVDDLNDNSPLFPNPTIKLDLAENAKVGTFLRLDSATDKDTPGFGILRYELDTTQDYFKLVQDNIDGSIIPQLELIKQLDYERRSQHRMILKAIDGGERIGEAEVVVRVVDVNDHAPVFATDRIECNIPEDLSVGDVVTMLNASDGDYGENSRIVYSYQETLVSPELADMFKLDTDTGIITIGANLDFEKQKQHILYIRAIDNGANAVPAYATVVVNVFDVNDNRPEISVSFIGDGEKDQSVHYVSEDIAQGEFLAFVSVTDRDAGEEGRELSTELEGSQDFELVTVDRKNNRYILQTKNRLDRERIESYDLTIKSVDNGEKRNMVLKSTKTLSIVLNDINDNSPYFAHGQYHVSINENNAVGDLVTQLEAQDLDAGENGRLTYSLVNPSQHFSIDAQTGEILATVQLDAEILTEPEVIEIRATDNGIPRRNGTTSLRISIKDFNDNAPVFVKKAYDFQITENLPVTFIIGEVKAIDGDMVPSFKYRIEQDYPYFPFDVDASTGKLFVDSKLDYESRHQNFEFTVLAIDSDGLHDRTNVSISILDENDNPPRVKYPQPSKDIVWISPKDRIGDVVCTIKVFDADSGANGDFSFVIEDLGTDLIQMDQNGQLIMQRELKRNDYGKFAVFVNIVDHGVVPLSTPLRINILVADEKYTQTQLPLLLRQYKEELALPNTAGVSQLAMLLVAAFSALVFILLLFTICIYCRYSRKSSKQQEVCFEQPHHQKPNLGASIGSSRHEESLRNWNELKTQSDRSYVSQTGSCTRDSGAGDSVESEFEQQLDSTDLPLIYKSPIQILPVAPMLRKPTFTTFMGDSDTDSVQIMDYSKESCT